MYICAYIHICTYVCIYIYITQRPRLERHFSNLCSRNDFDPGPDFYNKKISLIITSVSQFLVVSWGSRELGITQASSSFSFDIQDTAPPWAEVESLFSLLSESSQTSLYRSMGFFFLNLNLLSLAPITEPLHSFGKIHVTPPLSLRHLVTLLCAGRILCSLYCMICLFSTFWNHLLPPSHCSNLPTVFCLRTLALAVSC